LREAHRLSENIFNFPLQSGARSSHPTPLVQQEQLDPVSVDQGAAEADAELEQSSSADSPPVVRKRRLEGSKTNARFSP
jgi:hypothetical protein